MIVFGRNVAREVIDSKKEIKKVIVIKSKIVNIVIG